jgi:nonribosomal peptide synthetase protein BlmIV
MSKQVVVVQEEDKTSVLAVISLFLLDGYTEKMIGDEILAFFAGRPTPQTTELRYIDCLRGLNKLRHSEAHEKAREYWRSRIAGFPGRPELPVRATPADSKLLFEHHEHQLPPQIWSDIKKICSEHGSTPNALLLSLYLQVLARWSQTKHFAVTVMMTRRTSRAHPELEHVMGNLASTLLIAANCEEVNVTLSRFIHQVSGEVASAMDHSAMDGLEVVQEINKHLKRPFDAYAPFAFSSVVGVRSEFSEDPKFANVVKRKYSCVTIPHTWMDLQTSEFGGALIFALDVLRNIFPEVVVQQMLEAYDLLLRKVADRASWEIPISELFRVPSVAEPLTPPCEVPHVLLYEPFLEKAARAPKKTAVMDADMSIDYGDLDKFSFALAFELLRVTTTEAVPADTGSIGDAGTVGVTAILLPKSYKQVVATVGVLRAHMTYMPLDPNLPKHRLEHLLRVSGTTAIVSDGKTLSKTDLDADIPKLNLDVITDDSDSVNTEGRELKVKPISAMTTAYLLYTSGSTGIPKGVCCHHLGAYNTCSDLLEKFGISESDSVLSLSSLSFDLSVFDIFGLLAAGGTIVIPPAEGILEPELWLEAVEKHSVTIWNTVPAFMELLLSAAETNFRPLPGSLRAIMMSGDVVPPSLPLRIREAAPRESRSRLRVISLGGATEAAIWSNMFDTGEKITNWTCVPYGRPLRNQSMLILDPHLRLCEEWVVGAIHIGGVGVANGYLNDEAQNAKHFLETEKYGRLFRTGDLGRLREGYIEILGREDSQVKINGFRIELGEIERCAGRFAAVDDCCVVVTQNSLLVAFLVLAPEAIESHSEDFSGLREYLQQHLPHYMVPHIFVKTESLPLTTNGKIDRKDLTALANEHHSKARTIHGSEQKNPVSEKEKILHSAISHVLKFSEFGVDNDLFDLGCDSVALLNIIGELRRRNIRLKISDIFMYPTIAQLATIAETIKEGNRELFTIVPRPEEHLDPFPMIGIQRGYWLGMYVSDALGGMNNHFYREYEIFGDFSPRKMEMAVNRLIERHPMLRAVITETGEVVQLPTVPFWQLPVFEYDAENSENFETLHLPELRKKILCGPDPHNWPLWQLEVHHLKSPTNDRWYVLLDTSIMMLDGVAGGILATEFLKFYLDENFNMERLTLNFRDYAIAHESLTKSIVYREAQEYWLNRINNLPPCPSLPLLDLAGSSSPPSRHFIHYGGRLNSELWAQVQKNCTALQITPTMMFCTLYSELISRWSENHQFLLTIMHTKRWPVHPEVDHVVGNFSQTVLLEVDLRDSMSVAFEEHCRRITRQLTTDLDNAAFAGTDVAQEINRRRGSQFKSVAPYAFTSTLSFDGLSTVPEMKEVTPFSGHRKFSIVTVPHTWMDHQVAEDCGELLYNFDVLDGIFDDNLLRAMIEAYQKFLSALCDPKNWSEVTVDSLFGEPRIFHARVVDSQATYERRLGIKATKKKKLPETPFEKAVAEEFARSLKLSITDISIHGNFFDLGGSSLTALQLIMNLKSKLRVVTTATKFFENPTVSGLCSETHKDPTSFGLLNQVDDSLTKPILVHLRQSTGPDPPTVYFIHAAGASVLSYRSLVQNLGDSSVFGVDDPALLDDETPFSYSSIEEVVNAYTTTIYENLLERNLNSCYVGGWSFGGVVTIEVVRRLEPKGIRVPTCFLFDSPLRETAGKGEEEEQERLEELLARAGGGATRAISHFKHCTELLKKHKLVENPKIRSNVHHFFASETCLPVEEIVQLTSSITLGTATHENIQGTHYTMLGEENALLIVNKLQTLLL